jgi:hypothetical protein
VRVFDSCARPSIVAVTNAKLENEAIADYYDRRRAMEKHVKDENTGIVYFEFRTDGRYRGVSYYFGAGNGCGFCTSDVTSSVRVTGGKVSGAIKRSEPGRPFEIALDTPVLSDDHGTALPADRGAPDDEITQLAL